MCVCVLLTTYNCNVLNIFCFVFVFVFLNSFVHSNVTLVVCFKANFLLRTIKHYLISYSVLCIHVCMNGLSSLCLLSLFLHIPYVNCISKTVLYMCIKYCV